MNSIIEQSTWLAINIYHEAQGEPFDGKVAVGHVVLNRLRKEEKSVKDVILRPMQFSWANGGKRPPIKDYSAFIDCQKAAIQCFEERLEGKDLFGANLYYNPQRCSPSWAKKATEVCVIGNHRFMKE